MQRARCASPDCGIALPSMPGPAQKKKDGQGGENGFSRKFSELRVTEFYAALCKSIQAVLQVVASSSDENSDIAILEDKKLYGYW
jgi:hypothetical protein